jgi:hypothetical protein
VYTLYRSLERQFDYVLTKGENAYGINNINMLTDFWVFDRTVNSKCKLAEYIIYTTPIATFSSIEDLINSYPELFI